MSSVHLQSIFNGRLLPARQVHLVRLIPQREAGKQVAEVTFLAVPNDQTKRISGYLKINHVRLDEAKVHELAYRAAPHFVVRAFEHTVYHQSFDSQGAIHFSVVQDTRGHQRSASVASVLLLEHVHEPVANDFFRTQFLSPEKLNDASIFDFLRMMFSCAENLLLVHHIAHADPSLHNMFVRQNQPLIFDFETGAHLLYEGDREWKVFLTAGFTDLIVLNGNLLNALQHRFSGYVRKGASWPASETIKEFRDSRYQVTGAVSKEDFGKIVRSEFRDAINLLNRLSKEFPTAYHPAHQQPPSKTDRASAAMSVIFKRSN